MIQIGTKLYGFCGGLFGRDSYSDKIVLAMGVHNGAIWAVCGDIDPGRYSGVYVVYGYDVRALERYTEPEEPDQY